jgi:hypothetical protein
MISAAEPPLNLLVMPGVHLLWRINVIFHTLKMETDRSGIWALVLYHGKRVNPTDILTGREHGLSSTTMSSSTWISLMGFARTGVSCLQYNHIRTQLSPFCRLPRYWKLCSACPSQHYTQNQLHTHNLNHYTLGNKLGLIPNKNIIYNC